MTCPDDDLLTAMLQGDLGPDEARALEAHLDVCPTCLELVVALLGTDSPAAAPPLPTVGRYEVLERIGAGGQGLVFAAFDPQLHRRVAIKLLRPDRAPVPARLHQEARVLASLSHPNVMPVFEVGPWGDGLFLVTELGHGSLRAWADTPHPWREVVAAWCGVGAGLAAAHRAGLVHRDVKPDNVVLHTDGRPLLTDFGLASASPATESGAGTPLYLAPELVDGAPADARSDQFALCVSLYETLTGAPPFAGRTPAELAAAARRGPPPRPPGVPASVHAAIIRGLAPAPADRFPDIQALCEALDAASTPIRRPPLVGIAAAAAMVAVFGAGLLAVVGTGAIAAVLVAEAPPSPARAPTSPPPIPTSPAASLVAPCDELAADLDLAPCERDVCAARQRSEVMGLAHCYANHLDCEPFRRWIEALVEMDPDGPIDDFRASSAACPPAPEHEHATLVHFINFARLDLTSDDPAQTLEIGARARAWAHHPLATEEDIDGLWWLQMSVAQTLLHWHDAPDLAAAEARRGADAFDRTVPEGVL